MITIKINNVEKIFYNDWSISIKFPNRSTFEGNYYDIDDLGFNFGDTLEVYDDTNRIFAGIIRNLTKFSQDESNKVLTLKITAIDYTILCEKRVIAQVIEDMKADDIITTYIMPILAEEGITEGFIDADFTISRDVWRYFKISECLDRLANLQVGYIWYIDNDKKLHFYEKNNGNVVYINDSTNVYNISQSRNMDFYRNVQYVLTPELRTSEQPLEIMSPRADGTTRTFLSRFSIAEKPTLWYTNDITAGTPTWNLIDSADIGVNGIDSDKKWYWSYNSQTVSQADTETVLPVNGAMRITYIGLRKGIVKLKNEAEIDTRKLAESGTSGLYEHVLELQDIDDFYQAVKYCRSVLTNYGDIADSLTFDTNDPKFLKGSTVNMYSDFYKVYNALFLITDIHITQDTPELCHYSVSAYDITQIGDWEKFFFDIIKNQKKLILNVDDILTTINTVDEKITLDGSYYVFTFVGQSIPVTLPFTLGHSVTWKPV